MSANAPLPRWADVALMPAINLLVALVGLLSLAAGLLAFLPPQVATAWNE